MWKLNSVNKQEETILLSFTATFIPASENFLSSNEITINESIVQLSRVAFLYSLLFFILFFHFGSYEGVSTMFSFKQFILNWNTQRYLIKYSQFFDHKNKKVKAKRNVFLKFVCRQILRSNKLQFRCKTFLENIFTSHNTS